MKHLILALSLLFAALLPARAQASAVAVLYFENGANPELDMLKIGLAQMLITDLQGTQGLTIVERARLQAILDELELGHSGKVDEATAAQVGKLLGAEYMVMGSYFEMAGTLRIDTRVVRVETGEVVHAKGVHGGTSELWTLEKDIAQDLSPVLAEHTRKTRDEASTGSETPVEIVRSAPALIEPDPEALQAALSFSEGLIFLDKKDAPRAREAFDKAVRDDPALEAAAQDALASLDL
jgi:TolB-like protein